MAHVFPFPLIHQARKNIKHLFFGVWITSPDFLCTTDLIIRIIRDEQKEFLFVSLTFKPCWWDVPDHFYRQEGCCFYYLSFVSVPPVRHFCNFTCNQVREEENWFDLSVVICYLDENIDFSETNCTLGIIGFEFFFIYLDSSI